MKRSLPRFAPIVTFSSATFDVGVEGMDPLAGIDEQIRRRRTQEAVKRVLLRESLNQPPLLIFEDLHWIDGETQGFLNLLAEGVANAPLMLLVNYRPVVYPPVEQQDLLYAASA